MRAVKWRGVQGRVLISAGNASVDEAWTERVDMRKQK